MDEPIVSERDAKLDDDELDCELLARAPMVEGLDPAHQVRVRAPQVFIILPSVDGSTN